jgi:2,5-dioxopentanoate dehydrogenase
MPFSDATPEETEAIMQQSHAAFLQYRKVSFKQRADLMRNIAATIDRSADTLIATAARETNLPETRLRTEKTRTVFQWTSYAEACETGDWLNCSIDTANLSRVPPKPDLRKTKVPLGPVLVFGASNFPFAYSTAGGDTASAIAAGCTVVVKGHPAHPQTSQLMAELIIDAVKSSGLPDHIFQHVHGASFETSKLLVEHPLTKAVGFTGSVSGGTALFQWANKRPIPIPVFAEMGSVNPVFLFPGKLSSDPVATAKMLAASVTLGSGQFCTKPGLIVALDDDHTKKFISSLAIEISKSLPAKMLHQGIASAYVGKKKAALSQDGVQVQFADAEDVEGSAALASVTDTDFLSNPILHEEVFGPYSLVVTCGSIAGMKKVADALHGQLTSTVMATENDMEEYADVVDSIKDLCGRMIFNGVPTGVEVALSMHHGGPFPATTDSRFTAVGADAIRRFARPVCYQNWPNDSLPDELKNANPLKFWRRVNNYLTQAPIG